MATELWRWQGGTGANDGLLGATVGPDGCSILAGITMENTNSTSTNTSEWMAVKLDADGTLQWQWQGGVVGFTPSDAEAMGEDGSVVMVGDAGDTPPHSAAVKFDENGTLLWEWQDTTLLGSTVVDAALARDGSVILAGSTSPGVLYELNGLGSFAASKLDPDGGFVWEWEDGTSETDKIQTAVVGDDDSVVLAGYTYGNWSGLKSGEFEADFAAVKLDAGGNELWRWQDGTTTSDTFIASAMGQDGSVVLAGVTTGTWHGSYAGGSFDFAAVKLDSSGDEVWRWQGGTLGEDVFIHAAVGDDGSFVLAGLTDGEWGDSFDDSSDFAAVKLDENGNELWRWQGGSAEAAVDQARVIATGTNGVMLLAGWTFGSWTETPAGGVDFAAIMLDTGTSITPSPTGPPSAPPTTSGLATPVPAVPEPLPTAAFPSSTSPVPASPDKPPTRQPTLVLAPSTPARAVPSPAPSSPSSISALPEPTSPAPTTKGPTDVAELGPGLPSPAPALPSPSSNNVFSPTNIGIVSSAATLAVIIAGVILRKKHTASKSSAVRLARGSVSSDSMNASGGKESQACSPGFGGGREIIDPPPYPHDYVVDPEVGTTGSRSLARSTPGGTDQRRGGAQVPPAFNQKGPEDVGGMPAIATKGETVPDTNGGTLTEVGPSKPSGSSDIAKAVVKAAYHLALQCPFPGVCEAATLVSSLVNLIRDDQGNTAEMESRVKRCRLVIMILQRAAMVLGKGNDATGEMGRMLIEDVQSAVGGMVELIKTYRSKRRISKVIVSTMFKRRMEETEAVIDRAISDLKLGLHVHAAVNDEEFRLTGDEPQRQLQGLLPSPTTNGKGKNDELFRQRQASERTAVCIAAARRLRRERNLNQVEIPEDNVTISSELLGKGGFGSVFIADYNGRNAAAKVIKLDHKHSEIGSKDASDVRGTASENNSSRQRASLLLELQAMLRLRSPHTVNVYGAITSRKDRLVLVMELLTGGDLRSFLSHTEERLPEAKTRQIIGDVCAGMAFLHSKKAVHGDLKSANILLDGEGRAKIGDFGTSRWAHHSDSTGLATYKTNAGDTMKMMSFAWAAPEVLDAKGSSYASDVYSFGIVAWEVLSRKVPWADESLPVDIYRRVVFKGDRPVMPAGAPDDIADIVRECWAGMPRKRPPASRINGRLRYFRLQEEE